MSRYEIKPGIQRFETAQSELFVVARRTPNDAPVRNAPVISYAAKLRERPHAAYISLIFNPRRLGELRLWRDISLVPPIDLSNQLHRQVEKLASNRDSTDALVLLNRFALAAAAGLVQVPRDYPAIDTIVSDIPTYHENITQVFSPHREARGALEAFVRRCAAVDPVAAP